jgi:EAL domain-containing protein (putative c-di-GMP-specific phosphodiesterase class I)
MDVNFTTGMLLGDDTNNDLNMRLNRLLALIRKHLDMDVAFISEFTSIARVFKFVDTKKPNAIVKVGNADPLTDTYCNKLANQELDNIIPDTSKNEITCNMAVTKKLNIGAYIGVPLTLSNGNIYGTFCCYNEQKDNALNQRDLAFLNLISELASEIIEKKLQEAQTNQVNQSKVLDIINSNNLEIYYQPIYSLNTNKVSGYESLSRFFVEPYRPPNLWFDEAAQFGLGETLEMLVVKNTLGNLNRFNSDVYVSINTSPEHILSGAIANALATMTDCSNIVLEVTEHSPIADYSKMLAALAPLRDKGIRLAIDDVGAGYSSFQHILELQADIIKLDISLTRSINTDRRKFLLAKALCSFAKDIGCNIIAEGIETQEEINTLRKLNVDKVQGFYLGRPQALCDALVHQNRVLA